MLLTTPREIGAYIRDRRKAAGLTQKELADRNRVSARWLVDIEAGKATAQLGMVLRVLTSLGVVLDASEPGRSSTQTEAGQRSNQPSSLLPVDLDISFPPVSVEANAALAEAIRRTAPNAGATAAGAAGAAGASPR